MAKVFTITEGLENMGAMKTGGQGSVYKARRYGPILTAVKLLPTPIHSESADDKNFTDFQNEVEKLKKVNEQPNPNVVKILSSGLTESGGFPFIEMEYIEGPDMEELLKPPHEPVFTVKESVKVAEQLSNALAHCHKVNVRHGDIKSNNVKFNINSGNYVLLDFGLAVMSDEQRRTSLRHAGAIEFMAPEQNEGQMLYETDVYSFGVILFELLAGIVPFPLTDKGETSRNKVMISHMELQVPDMLALRKEHLPESWSAEKQQRELNVPDWLVSLVYRCLEKKPEDRFENGVHLHEYIVLNSTLATKQNNVGASELSILQNENHKLLTEKGELQSRLSQYQHAAAKKDQDVALLTQTVSRKDAELIAQKQRPAVVQLNEVPVQNGVSKAAFYVLLFLTIGFGALAAYSFLFKGKTASTSNVASYADSTISSDDTTDASTKEKLKDTEYSKTKSTAQLIEEAKEQAAKVAAMENEANGLEQENGIIDQGESQASVDSNTTRSEPVESPSNEVSSAKYKVISVAYFHNKPDESTRRNAFINHWNNATLTALNETDNFIYVIFKNDQGQVSKGWLRKGDLKHIE